MSSETYPNKPLLTWDGFLDTMLSLAKIFGFILCIGLALAIIVVPIFFIYRRCKQKQSPAIEQPSENDEKSNDIELVVETDNE